MVLTMGDGVLLSFSLIDFLLSISCDSVLSRWSRKGTFGDMS